MSDILKIMGDNPCHIKDLIEKTGLAGGYVRTEIRDLRRDGFIERVSKETYQRRKHGKKLITQRWDGSLSL